MASLVEKALETMKKMEGFKLVKFIIYHGSSAEGRATEESDIDLCVYFDGSEEKATDFRFRVLSELSNNVYDVQMFQLLPLYVRKEILKGKIVYCTDNSFLYDIALRTIRDFEDFSSRFYDYIGERAIV